MRARRAPVDRMRQPCAIRPSFPGALPRGRIHAGPSESGAVLFPAVVRGAAGRARHVQKTSLVYFAGSADGSLLSSKISFGSMISFNAKVGPHQAARNGCMAFSHDGELS